MGSVFATEGSTVYLSLKVESIRNYDEVRFLKCSGATYRRDLKSPSGYRRTTFGIEVKVKDFLVEYVDFEISQGDNIFVVGYLDDDRYRRPGLTLIYPILVAEKIFKEDYLKYYPRRVLEGKE